jgi:hypothetical protein
MKKIKSVFILITICVLCSCSIQKKKYINDPLDKDFLTNELNGAIIDGFFEGDSIKFLNFKNKNTVFIF